jgi:hypothetical protein
MEHMGLQIVQVPLLLILEGLVMRTGRAGKEVSWKRGKQVEHFRLSEIFD